ncbi:MAG: energy transducer TonB [Alphaproteobacteria bacterium]|nr:energy transducer TonB [Alphaproteobacteria bacterium]MBV9692881.1 energy transducer TonB [Alphaproteobacteria bacterium]
MRVSTIGRQCTVGAGILLVAMLGGSTLCFADSPAKVDHSYPNMAPEYPDASQLAEEQGDVVLDVQVDSSGRPNRIRVKRSSGFTDLDNAAIETAANWHFIPAVVDGDLATSWTTIKIHYELPKPAAGRDFAETAQEHELNVACGRPAAPPPVDGATATATQMDAAHQALNAYLDASQKYERCLHEKFVDAPAMVLAGLPEWKSKVARDLLAKSQTHRQMVADNFDTASMNFKARGVR